MAIYHLSMKIISRSSGYSAVASAYRSGSLMLDERTGLTHDYTRKSQAEAVILTPATAPAWQGLNRAELWNAVEGRTPEELTTCAGN